MVQGDPGDSGHWETTSRTLLISYLWRAMSVTLNLSGPPAMGLILYP